MVDCPGLKKGVHSSTFYESKGGVLNAAKIFMMASLLKAVQVRNYAFKTFSATISPSKSYVSFYTLQSCV